MQGNIEAGQQKFMPTPLSLESLETAATLGAKNDAALIQNKATDQWSFFQAKSIKKNMYEIAAMGDGPHADEFRAAPKAQRR